MKKNLFVSILVYLALAICAITIIPFKAESIATVESIIKFVVFPLVIIAISLGCLLVRKNDKSLNKLGAYSSVLPVTAYVTSVFAYLSSLPLRNHSRCAEIALDDNCWVGLFVAGIVATVLFAVVSALIPLYKAHKNVEHKVPVVTFLMYMFLIAICLPSYMMVKGYAGSEFADSKNLALGVSIGLAVVLTCINVVEYAIVTKNMMVPDVSEVEENYQAFEDQYLWNMYNFAKTELIQRGNTLDEQTAPQTIEVEKVVEVPVEKVVEKVVEVPVEKVVYVDKVVEKVVEPAKVERPKPVKEKKAITPEVSALAKFATDTFEDVSIVYGKDEENFKILRGKKLMMIVQRTNNDYRIFFQRKPISVAKMIIKYPSLIVKANSPKGEQWFKLTNKGEFSEEDLFAIIKFSYKYMADEEAKAIAKKEKEKERARAKKEALKQKERARVAAIKQKEKDKIAAEKAKEKAKQDAIKAKEKAKQDAIKAKEKEKQAAIKAKEKEKQAAIKAKEKEKAKQEALKAKEKEKAKQEALKAKEQAKQEALKVEENQEQAKPEVVEEVENKKPSDGTVE